MSKRPPPKHYVSSMSEDDYDAGLMPPPPPLPPLDTVIDNSPPVPSNTKRRISPPPVLSSVLRANSYERGGSKNSVAFSGVMDNRNTTPSPPTIANLPSIAAANAAAAASISASSELNNRHHHKVAPSISSRITLDTVINSQFENEAETHILAALEMEESDRGENQSTGLLGEGIEGMEDYSDDDDYDDDHERRGSQEYEVDDSGHARSLTWNNNNFLGAVAMQNQLPQYQVGLSYSEAGESVSSTSTGSPQKRIEQHHRRHLTSASSARGGSGYLPSVPDDAALLHGRQNTATGGSLATHIKNEHMEEGDDPFLEGEASRVAASIAPGNSDMTDDEGSGDQDAHHSIRQEANNNRDGKGNKVATEPTGDVNIMTDASGETDNLNFMAQRLRSLQRRRSSLKRSISTRSSRTSSKGLGLDAVGDEPNSCGDKLIDALTSVDSSKNKKSPWRKLKSEYKELIVPKLPIFRKNISHIVLFVIFPSLSVACVLFYMLDNPMAGNSGTSLSWWFLFLGVRQMVTFELTRVGEVFWVEILALRSRLFTMAVGPYVSLGVIQSKGWPYIICFWAVLDFCFLYGPHPFAKHWLFWQNKLDIFNEANPVVGITDSQLYMRILFSCIFVGVAASLKRLFLAIYLGRRSVSHFGPELEKLMAKMILIGEVANLARDIENKRSLFEGSGMMSPTNELGEDEKLVRFRELMEDENSSMEATPSPRSIKRKTLEVPMPPPQPKAVPPPPPVSAPNKGNPNPNTPSPQMIKRKLLQGNEPTPNSAGSTPKPSPGSSVSQGASPGHKRSPNRPSPPGHSPQRPSLPLRGSSSDTHPSPQPSSTTNVKLMYLLSEWEEPETSGRKSKATVRDLVEFRNAKSHMDDQYPFSYAFGHAKTREMCVQSSQEVYDRLMLSAGDCSALPFSILSVLAVDENGEFVEAKIKSLIRLFRPDRQGNLSRLDFVKSVDTVYKQLRLLRASIANSAQIDYAFERIVNWFFYFFLVIVAVSILGISIWTVFLSFNTFFLGFSFLFGSAASNYFEGLLLIFVRRPYDIGDKIATSNPASDTSPNGSSTWYVDKVTLFATTVRYATTNEVATYSNGSLAVLRIINANRSPKAIISVMIKFGLETPFNKITVFRSAVENFIKARPREWIALAGFRATRVEADFGYVEYKIVAQHRESWQNISPVLQSKADLSSFCLEATKKLDMKYESPPMPVNLSTSGPLDLSGMFHDEDDEPKGDVAAMADNKKISAEDLQEVANLFEIRKKQK